MGGVGKGRQKVKCLGIIPAMARPLALLHLTQKLVRSATRINGIRQAAKGRTCALIEFLLVPAT